MCECVILLLFQAVMVGDDIVSDIGGAQACGIRGLQVRTGKYRFTLEHYHHCTYCSSLTAHEVGPGLHFQC